MGNTVTASARRPQRKKRVSALAPAAAAQAIIPARSLPNYGYSSAMKGADFVWDKEKLDRFIAKPDEVVPGNNMKPYGGLTSAEDRARVIVFLESPTTN